MNVTTFAFPTTVRFGPGAVNELPAELERRGIKRPLLVTDAGLARTPLFERVAGLIPEAVIFSGVDPNPTEQNVLDGVEIYRQNLCDGVVGLGGGSPLSESVRISRRSALGRAKDGIAYLPLAGEGVTPCASG